MIHFQIKSEKRILHHDFPLIQNIIIAIAGMFDNKIVCVVWITASHNQTMPPDNKMNTITLQKMFTKTHLHSLIEASLCHNEN